MDNPVQLATESSAWQQPAGLTAILGFCTESRRSKWGHRMGGGDIVLCAVCNNIGMLSLPVIVLAMCNTLFVCDDFCMMLFSGKAIMLKYPFTIRSWRSLQEACLLVWKLSTVLCVCASVSVCCSALQCDVYTHPTPVNVAFFRTHVTVCQVENCTWKK